MVQENTWFESSDGTKLYLRRWLPEPPSTPLISPSASSGAAPLAIVHIVHGMAEHSGRYGRLAEVLCGAGIEVWAADQRGHGKTADLSINSPEKGGLLGHCADSGTFGRVTADIDAINREIRKAHPGIPLFLLGHSWGSFIVQNYLGGGGRQAPSIDGAPSVDGVPFIDGCILSGTRGPGGFKLKAGRGFLTLLAFVCGKRRKSALARAVVDGSYNKPFRPNRTPFDWLSRDEAEVDAYINDPYSGKLCTAGFYRDLAAGLCRIHRSETVLQIRKNVPIYIFGGSADPVGEMGASPTALVAMYRLMDIEDLEFVLYPGARHETLNETNRGEVMNNLLSWICRHAVAGIVPAEVARVGVAASGVAAMSVAAGHFVPESLAAGRAAAGQSTPGQTR